MSFREYSSRGEEKEIISGKELTVRFTKKKKLISLYLKRILCSSLGDASITLAGGLFSEEELKLPGRREGIG